jgi:hypothetical protein
LERHGVSCGVTRDGTPRDNFAHDHLAQLMRGRMMWDERRWTRREADILAEAILRLKDARTDAEYDPLATFTADDAQDAVKDAAIVLAALRVDLE